MNTCSKCKETKSIDSFSREFSGKYGLRSWCKDCDSEYSKRRNHYKTHKAEYLRLYAQQYQNDPRNRIKIKARLLTKQAIKQGLIKPKDFCEECGSNENIEIHHPNYNEPLKIQWLCKRHHWKADQLLKI